jgi:hypothetical protein
MDVPTASAKPPLHAAYRALHRRWGPQHWWPGRSRFEMIVGAILTQNTAWTNVEQAIANLRRARALTPRALDGLPVARLAALIRPAGYFNVKARRLQAFTRYLVQQHGGSLDRLFRPPTAEVRHTLLGLHGIGPETADSILYRFQFETALWCLARWRGLPPSRVKEPRWGQRGPPRGIVHIQTAVGIRKIPDLARALGRSLGEFKKGREEGGTKPDDTTDKKDA